jgi:hypothetical protein
VATKEIKIMIKLVIVDPDNGNKLFKDTNCLPRLGDKVCFPGNYCGEVEDVILWPTPSYLEVHGLTDADVEAVIWVK